MALNKVGICTFYYITWRMLTIPSHPPSYSNIPLKLEADGVKGTDVRLDYIVLRVFMR